MSATKRTHKKSRKGCNSCRARRVKCDEKHPVCSNCKRRNSDCAWPVPAIFQFDPRSEASDSCSQGPRKSSSSPFTGTSSSNTASSTPQTLSGSPPPPPSTSALDFTSLTLLQHYMSSTYLTFGPCPIAREVWRTNVSRIATAHPYLMHLLLSVSALHFSFLHASSRSKYELIAASHYNTGSQALREVIALWESSDGQAAIDSEALFAASGMLLFYVVASPHLPVPKSLTWFPLMTGIRAIMGAHGHVLRDGELADLVGGRKGDEAGTPTSSQDRMEHKKYRIFPELPDHLFTIYLNLPSTPEVAEVEDPEVASIYQMAVNQLKELCDNAPDPLAMVFVWPGVVSSEFLGYVIEERSRALVILAYYCAVSWTGVNEWWMKGQVAAELGGIRNLLGDSWQGWLEWPDSILQTVTGTLGAGG